MMDSRQRSFVSLRIAMALFAGALAWTLVMPAPARAEAPLIVIDPGHGGPYSNANANRLREKNVNLWIALELKQQLVARGYRVVLTRTRDRAVNTSDLLTWNWSSRLGRWTYARDGRRGYVGGIPKDDLQARCDIANSLGADLFISIHNNGAVRRSVRGTETWASPRDLSGRQLARLVQRAVVRRTGLRNRGAHAKDFYVMRWSNMPGLLVEGAFISSPSDARFLRSTWGRRRLAQGIAEGVTTWFATRSSAPLYPRSWALDSAALAAAVSASDFPGGAPVAVVARSADLTGAPGASGLATAVGGPLLLLGDGASPSALPTSTATELARLRPQRLIVAASSGVLDDASLADLASAAALPASSVQVAGGGDTLELSANLARLMGSTSSSVAIARVDDCDAVAQAALSATLARMPLLLVPGSQLGSAATSYFAERGALIATVFVFGSTTSIPDEVVAGLPGVRRIAGADRAQVAAAELYRSYSGRRWGTLVPIVADSKDPAAVAVAATRGARTGQPVVQVSGQVLSPFTREWITNNRSAISSFQLVGSHDSLPLLVDWMLAKAETS